MSTKVPDPIPATVPVMVPAPYVALVDDAAVFPPGNAPLEQAVAEYRAHLQEPYADLVGPLVVPDLRLPDLLEIVRSHEAAAPLPISVVVAGGAGALEPAARWADGAEELELRALAVALQDLGDLSTNARRVVAAADLGLDVPVSVELPLATAGLAELTAGWLHALDVVAEADLRAKFRTGGLTADLVPSPSLLGAAIDAALDRELPFVCTAGLHHAVRTDSPGLQAHGFLNVLLAARAALDGDDVVAALALTDADAVVARIGELGEDSLTRARRWFVSFGCCGVQDPWADLVDLGLAEGAVR